MEVAMRRNLARTLVVTVTIAVLGILASTPTALAYGSNTQWQTAFSGTCSSNAVFCPFGPTGVHQGFWGWCAFGGSAADGLSGTAADCQVTTYFGPGTSFHISFDITGWVVHFGSPFVPPGVPDFLVTSGTLELTGAGAAANPFGYPVGVPTPIHNPCEPIVCDTGIPVIPGHFSFHPTPGVELNIQVTKLP
jgi:hypothetical protein